VKEPWKTSKRAMMEKGKKGAALGQTHTLGLSF